MSSLTDFLLARIAEDEAARDDVHHERCGLVLCSDCTAGPFPCDCGRPARVLAECEAKRRIADQHLDNVNAVTAYRSPQWVAAMTEQDRVHAQKAEARCAATERVVLALAQVYRSHPAFDTRWTP